MNNRISPEIRILMLIKCILIIIWALMPLLVAAGPPTYIQPLWDHPRVLNSNAGAEARYDYTPNVASDG